MARRRQVIAQFQKNALRFFWVLPLSALLLGCPPQIGNKCTLSTDCSQIGDRLCDTSQPDGYCTVFNCEPDQCPDSVCVAFDPSLDPACRTAGNGRTPRFERSFCMKPCNSDGNCRDQYQCVDLTPMIMDASGKLVPNPNLASRSAQVVDTNPWKDDGGAGYKVCMVAANLSPPDVSGGIPAVCLPPDAGYVDAAPWPAYEPDAGAGDAGDGGVVDLDAGDGG